MQNSLKNIFKGSFIFLFFLSSNLYSQNFKPEKKYDSSISKLYPEHETILGGKSSNSKNTLFSKNNFKPGNKNFSIKTLKSNNFSDLIINKIVYSNENKLPIFIKATRNKISNSDSIITIKSQSTIKSLSFDDIINSSKEYIHQLEPYLTQENFIPTFKFKSLSNDEIGFSHVKFSQIINDIPIYGSEIIIHLNNLGEPQIFNGKYVNVLTPEKSNVFISEIEALQNIDKYYIQNNITKSINFDTILQKNIVDTTYFINTIGNPVLSYHIISFPNPIHRYEFFIDATNGEILQSIETTCSFAGPSSVIAIDLNGKSKTINTYFDGSKYFLKDITKPIYSNLTNKGFIETYDARNTSYQNFKYEFISNTINTFNDSKAVSAHSNASTSFDYFFSNHNRKSIDNNSGNIYSYVNVAEDSTGVGMDNAYWSGRAMYYGNGNNLFKPLAGGLDVAGHEMTHGVVESTANLEYNGQSGAMNESFADIFGALIDSSNWTMGEDIILSKALKYYPNGCLRSLKDPHNGGFSNNDPSFQPNKMNEYFYGSADNYGVHKNSGIPNYAFYLLATGPVGKINAGKIYYRALNNYLVRKSQFLDLRIAVIQAAKDLFSNINADKYAAAAFDSVGIIEIQNTNTNIVSKTIPVNPGDEYLITYNTDATNPNGIYRSDSHGLAYTSLGGKLMGNKISVTDNGNNGVFVGTDKKLYLVNVNVNKLPNISVFQNQAIWSSVAMSKDGKRLAGVTTSADTSIWVYDFNKTKWFRFKLYAPTYSNVKAQGPVYADALEWDYNGEYIIYDCFNKVSSTTTNSISFWDINVINVWDNSYDTVASGDISNFFSLGENDNIGNPVLAKNSPFVMAFDYFNPVDKQYIVAGYDFQRDSLNIIYNNNTVGNPSFNKLDDSLYFVTLDSKNISFINKIRLDSSKVSSIGNPTKILSTSKWPISYTIGNREFVTPPKPRVALNNTTTICSTDIISMTSSNKTGNQWYLNGVLVKDSIRQSYITNVAGSYSVISSNGILKSEFSDPVIIYVKNSPLPPKTRDTSYCLNQNVSNLTAQLNSTNNKLRWYGSSAIGGIYDTLAPKTPNSNIASVYNYYVSEYNSNIGCESYRSKITITVNSLPAPPVINDTSFCNNANVDSLKVSNTNGNSILWYGTNATGGVGSITPSKPNTSTVGIFSYYLSQLNKSTNCESYPRSKINVTIKPNPTAPILARDSAGYLGANINSISWYKDGNLIADTSQKIKPLTPGSYTVKTTQNGCLSPFSTAYYFLITDIINLDDNQFIKVTPNPFSTNVYLHFFLHKFYTLNVDVLEINSGSIVASRKGLNTGANLNIESLSSGIYAVRVYSNDFKMTYTFKLVKL